MPNCVYYIYTVYSIYHELGNLSSATVKTQKITGNMVSYLTTIVQ